MADWYVSSTNYAALTQWAASTTYSIGNIRRGLAAPAITAQSVFIVSAITTGISGGTEPTWNNNQNATITDGGVTWKCVTGQSATNWTTPAGNFQTLSNFGVFNSGDRVFLSSDHAQTQASGLTVTPNASSIAGPMLIISVNKAGSVPPAAADYLAGASFATTGANSITLDGNARYVGITVNSGASIGLGVNTNKALYLRGCALFLNNATSGSSITGNSIANQWSWQDTTVQFGNTGQSIKPGTGFGASSTLDWFGAGSGVTGSTFPTNLFISGATSGARVTVRGVNLSNLSSGCTLVNATGTASTPVDRYTFSNCKLGASVTIANISQASGAATHVEAINCDSANTNDRCERWCSPQGSVTTETNITLSGGASDGTNTFSRKMVTTANVSEFAMPLEGFPMDVWNTSTGSSKTATVEIISSGTLTNADISLQLEYLSDASSCQGTVIDNFLATELTTPASVTSSSATWNSSPATPVKQKLQVTFTPQKAGIVRGIVSLRKASTTAYVNPVITIT